MEESTRSDRARYHTGVRDIYYQLKHEAAKADDDKPFEKLKDVFMMAAVVGFNNRTRRPLGEGRTEGIRTDVFSESDIETMKALAVAETGDVAVLAKRTTEVISGEVLTIVEEYAHGGIEELKRQLIDTPGDTLTNLVDLVFLAGSK